jgi:hypothetical protein
VAALLLESAIIFYVFFATIDYLLNLIIKINANAIPEKK